MPNPVRIYVLHHPDSKPAAALTSQIYEWFRLPSLQGIPVYVRSVPGPDSDPPDQPALPSGMLKGEPVLEYLLPLVDDRMVRDPVWHDYLTKLAESCDASGHAGSEAYRGVIMPVALDTTAFNLPRAVSRWNFIRHGQDSPTAPADPAAREKLETEETLKHLTEALARDLNGHLFPAQQAARLKIFISYARADGTEIPKALRDYIQGETQCLAFLDENDIGYGQPFYESLAQNVGGQDTGAGKGRRRGSPASHPGGDARAMIVVNSDHYADRPWCRWEIGRFTRPREIPLNPKALRSSRRSGALQVFDPLLVVDALHGSRMTRVVPELAQAPVVRWEAGRARWCFNVLLREVLLGLRDVLVARQIFREQGQAPDTLFVNRLPGPLAIEELRKTKRGRSQARTIRYPGNGLSLIELRLLRQTFSLVGFRAFRDILPEDRDTGGRPVARLEPLRRALKRIEDADDASLPLRGKVLAVFTSYCEPDLAKTGSLPQHQDEALLHLLRPLLRLGADLYYGGLPPKASARPSATLNITTALLRLVSEERLEDQIDEGGKQRPPVRGSLLFNVCAWPRYLEITPRDEAAWINHCRIRPFRPEEAGLPPWTQRVPHATENPPTGYRRCVALTTSAIRARLGAGFEFRLPGGGQCMNQPAESKFMVKPAAAIFMGGKLSDFSGFMPGIMEEFLYAARFLQPMYVFRGLGGAVGVLASALCAPPNTPRPEALSKDYYLKQPVLRKHEDYAALLNELAPGDPDPQKLFDELWSLIEQHRGSTLDQLFNNGLTHAENLELLQAGSTADAVPLVWQGLSQILLPADAPAD